MLESMSSLDLAALIWFLFIWIYYALVADRTRLRKQSVA
jgi:uncharacterized membrane protein